MRKIFYILLFILFNLQHSEAQNTELFGGLNLPLNYALGYQQGIDSNFSVSFQAGLLTKPYNTIIIDVIEYFDANESVVNIIRNARSRGVNMQTGFKYHVNKGYVGASYACLILTVEDYMANVLYNYSGLELELPRNTYLTLNSYLHNAGVFFGRKVAFNDPRFSINIELAFQKTFYSTSNIKNDTGQEITSLHEVVNKDLTEYYLDYGIMPSLNLYFSYSF